MSSDQTEHPDNENCDHTPDCGEPDPEGTVLPGFHRLSWEDYLSFCEIVIDFLTEVTGVEVVVDQLTFREVIIRVHQSLKKIQVDGIDNPGCIKRGGCFQFWCARLKPFRVFSWSYLEDQLKGAGVSRCELPEDPEPEDKKTHEKISIYINEIIGIMVGASLAENMESSKKVPKFRVNIQSRAFQEQLANLRYDHSSERTCITFLTSSLIGVSEIDEERENDPSTTFPDNMRELARSLGDFNYGTKGDG